jgi:cytosine/adenosine deaminase-related metal-dependent hydrolase
MRTLHLEHALLPQGLRRDVAVTVDERGTITEVGEADPQQRIEGLALPGLVNAHVHLELSGPRVPGGLGLPAWVAGLRSVERGPQDIARAVRELQEFGTVAICEVTNTGAAAAALAGSSLCGVIYQEVLGIDEEGLPELQPLEVPGFAWRPTAHAPYSTSASRIQAAMFPGGARPTIHLDEDPAERTFLFDGSGPWGDFIRAVGRDLTRFEAPGCSPVSYLARLGVLKHSALVHAVLTSEGGLLRLAEDRVPVILCPRSNLHIGGRLADAPAMVRHGVPLALGTDSEASVPDLDLLQEVRTLMQAFPEVQPEVWLQAATRGGAELLDLGDLGRIEPGRRPGLLLVQGRVRDLGGREPIVRRWLVPPARIEEAA